MREIPFFFSNGAGELFGMLHEGVGEGKAPFVFCHPFGEEKLWSHRTLVSFARELARRGHTVLRFDYMGNGDSSGDFSESSIETALSDIASAIETIKHRTGANRVALLGLRLGAALAAQIGERRSDVDLLVLWSPIADGDRYLQELLRINLTTQMAAYREIREDREQLIRAVRSGQTANVDGYEISLRMLEEMSLLRMTGANRQFAGPCLVVQIGRMVPTAASSESTQIASQYRAASVEIVQEEPFWKEIERFYDTAPNLFATTLDWLDALSRASQSASMDLAGD